MPQKLDKATLEAALIGYQHQAQEIQGKIAELRRMIGGGTPATAKKAPAKKAVTQRKQRHNMSPEGRARIAAAQRARWAKAKKAQQ